MKSDRPGAILLEVLVAVAILGAAGIALVAQMHEVMATVHSVERRESGFSEANAFLEAISLWPRADLDRHLGDRPNGAWRLVVERPSSDLYLVGIRDSSDRLMILETALYRPVHVESR
jgi:hypothetical protein